MKYIASCSFGKDSLAMLIKIKELNLPLDEVIERIKQILNKHRFEENDDDYDELNDLLQKYKGDNNE